MLVVVEKHSERLEKLPSKYLCYVLKHTGSNDSVSFYTALPNKTLDGRLLKNRDNLEEIGNVP